VALRLSRETADKIGRKFLNFEMYAHLLQITEDTPDGEILSKIERDLVFPEGTLKHYNVLRGFKRLVVHPTD
jgi:hypothetical protein